MTCRKSFWPNDPTYLAAAQLPCRQAALGLRGFNGDPQSVTGRPPEGAEVSDHRFGLVRIGGAAERRRVRFPEVQQGTTPDTQTRRMGLPYSQLGWYGGSMRGMYGSPISRVWDRWFGGM